MITILIVCGILIACNNPAVCQLVSGMIVGLVALAIVAGLVWLAVVVGGLIIGFAGPVIGIVIIVLILV
jgi:hypothetical protein